MLRSRWLARATVAVAAAGGMTLMAASAAWAATETIPLKSTHQGQTAESGDWDIFEPSCPVDEFNDHAVPAGFDGWHFVTPSGEFQTLYFTFEDLAGDSVEITIDQTGATPYTGWIRADLGKHAYLFTPAGWTLLTGNADIAGAQHSDFNVSHTCVGVPSTVPPTATESPSPDVTPSEGMVTTPPGQTTPPAVDETEKPFLPVTGAQLGGLVVLGIGLLGGGGALMFLRRRHNLGDLTEG